MAKEVALGARISLIDRMTSGMNKVIGSLSKGSQAAEKMHSSVTQMSSATTSAASRSSSAMNAVERATSSASEKTKQLGEAAQQTSGKVTRLEDYQKRAAQAANQHRNASESLAESMNKYAKSAEQATKQTNQLTDSQSQAGNQASDLMNRLDNASMALQATGTAITAGGAGIAYGLGSAVKSAASFEQQMSTIKALTGATGPEMMKISTLATDMGQATKFSSVEAGKGIEELLKAGVSLQAVMGGGLKGALDLAVSGGLELAEAAEIASTALNAFKADQLSVVQAGNILAGAANASATSVSELKYGLSQVSAVASGVGLTFNDTVTTLAAFAQNGLKGSDAGTSLKTMLTNLTPKTKEQSEAFAALGLGATNATAGYNYLLKNGMNPSSKSIEDVSSSLMQLAKQQAGAGATASQISKQYDKLAQYSGFASSAFYDQNGSIRSMSEIAGTLQNALKGLNDEQRQTFLYQMFGSDAIRAGNILYKEGAKGIEKMSQAMSKVTAADVAKEKLNNLNGAIEQLKGAFETTKTSIGMQFIPVLTKMVKVAGGVVDFFNKMPQPVLTFLTIIAVLTSALGLVAGPLLILIGFIPNIVAGFGAIAGAVGMTSGALLGVVGTVFWWITAIIGIGAALVTAYKHSETFRNVVNKVFSSVGKVVQTAVTAVKGFAKDVFAQVANWWKKDGQMIQQAVSNVVSFFVGAWKKVSPVLSVVFKVFSFIVSAVWTNIKNVITSGVGMITNVISIFGALFTGNWSSLWENVRSLLKNGVTFIWNLVQLTFMGRLLTPIRAGFGLIRAIITGGWSYVKGLFLGSINGIVAIFRGGFNLMNAGVRVGMGGIRTFISASWTFIKGIFGASLQFIYGSIRSSFTWIRTTIVTVMQRVGVFVENVMNSMNTAGMNAFSKIRGYITTTKTKFEEFGTKTSEVIEAVKTTLTNAKNNVSDFFSPLIGFIDSVTSKWGTFKESLSNFKMPSINLPSMPSWLGGGKKEKADGSHYTGLSRVPFDGYKAILHRDEAVLTANEANIYRKYGLGRQTEMATATKTPQPIVMQSEKVPVPSPVVQNTIQSFVKPATPIINVQISPIEPPIVKATEPTTPVITNLFKPLFNPLVQVVEKAKPVIANVFKPLFNPIIQQDTNQPMMPLPEKDDNSPSKPSFFNTSNNKTVTSNTNHSNSSKIIQYNTIEITGGELAAMSENEDRFKETAEKLLNYLADKLEEADDNKPNKNREVLLT